MNNQDIVIVSLNPWDSPLNSTSKYVAKTLAKQNRVLYINPPLDRRTVLFKKNDPLVHRHLNAINGKEPDMVKISDNLWNYYPTQIIESINWIPSQRIFSQFNYRNNLRFADCIKNAISQLGFEHFILINDKDIFRSFYLKELLNPLLYIYYDRDFLLSQKYWKKHGTVLEPQLAMKSDLIVSHSDYLISLLKPYNSNIYNVGSGIDLSLFKPDNDYAIPQDIAELPGPIIGYVGALTALRLDLNALIRIAEGKPEWSLVLIGPEDDVFRDSILHQMKNVHFLGRKDFDTVPAYINAMDVCLNLQIINEITIGNYPLKVDEYLALGKPVVATETLGMKPFEGVVKMAKEGGDYLNLISQALAEGNTNRKKYIEVAESHSWDNVLENIYSAISETLHLKTEEPETEEIKN